MEKRVLLTDYVWPSVEPERIVLQNAGVEGVGLITEPPNG